MEPKRAREDDNEPDGGGNKRFRALDAGFADAFTAHAAHWRPYFIGWLLGGEISRALVLRHHAPVLVRVLEQALDNLVLTAPARALALLIELDAQGVTIPPLVEMLEPAAVRDLVAHEHRDVIAIDAPTSAFMRHFRLPDLLDEEHVMRGGVCSMHDLPPAEHMRFGTGLVDVLVGVAGGTDEVFGWISNLVLIQLAASEQCEIAHELVHLALREDALPAIELLVQYSPPMLLVDLAIDFPDLPNIPLDTLAQATALRPLRKQFRAALADLERDRLRADFHLFPYQRQVLQWLYEREHMGPAGGIIALEPGMGKTALMLALVAIQGGPTLVLAPLNVLNDWPKMNAMFRDDGSRLRLLRVHSFLGEVDYPTPEQLAAADVVITTVDTYMNRHSVYSYPWTRLIIDEVHAFSNMRGKKYKFVRAHCQAARRWGLTGTPFRNRREDIRAQLVLLNIPNAQHLEDHVLLAHSANVSYGRHTILLPVRHIVDMPVPLDPLEWDLYERVYDYTRTVVSNAPSFAFKQAAITRLRQLAISMDLVPPVVVDELRQAALQHMPGLLGRLWATVANTLSQWSNPLSDREPVVRTRPLPYPLLPADRRLAAGYVSARMRAVIGLLRKLQDEHPGDKIICFSNYAQPLHLLVHLLSEQLGWVLGRDMGMYLGVGDTPVREREVTRGLFETTPAMRLLLVSYGAGAAGMNLQQSNHIIELEPSWNNAVLQQGEARAWRIGQTKAVYVYRFYAPRTIEERVEAIRRRKEVDWADMRQQGDGEGEGDGDEPGNDVLDEILGF